MYEEKLVEQQMMINAVQHEKVCLQQMYHQQQVYQQQMFEQQMYQKQMYEQQMYEQQMYMQQMYFQSQQNNYQPMTTPDGRLLQPTPTIFFD